MTNEITITAEQIEAVKARAMECLDIYEKHLKKGDSHMAGLAMSKALGIRLALNMLGVEF